MSTELEHDLEAKAEEVRTESDRIMQNLRPMLEAKDAALTKAGQAIYTPGSRWRVVKEGARLEGIQTWGEKSYAGFARRLEIGDELIVTDWRKGMSEKSLECNFAVQSGPRPTPNNLLWCQVWPMASLWRPWPLDGYLERIS